MAAPLRTLYCLSVKFRSLVSATHLPGMVNIWADCLSRGWLEKFYVSCPQAAPFPMDIGPFLLDFSNGVDPQSRWPHCDLAPSVTYKFKEDGPGGWIRPSSTGLAGAARERTGPQAGGTGSTMVWASHSRPGGEQAPVSPVLGYVTCSPSQSANSVGAWPGQYEVAIAPGKDGTDSDPWLHPHSSLVFHSHMAPFNDQLSWMDYISHGGGGGSEGLSAYHSAWDPGGAVRGGQVHHGPKADSFISLAQNRHGQHGAISLEWYPQLVWCRPLDRLSSKTDCFISGQIFSRRII